MMIRSRRSVQRILVGLLLLVLFVAQRAASVEAHQPHDDTILVALSPNFAQDGTVFAATGRLSISRDTSVILKSTDAGQTWRVVPNFPNHVLNGFVFSPKYAQDSTVFASSATGGLFRSTNGGQTWTNLSTGGLGVSTVTVAVSPHFGIDQTVVTIGVNGSVYKSTDRGNTWSSLPVPAADAATDLDDGGGEPQGQYDPILKSVVAFSPTYWLDRVLFVALEEQGLYRSLDQGLTWTEVGAEMAGLEITSLVLAPMFAYTHVVYASTYAGVYVSINAGTTWFPINAGLSSQSVTGIALAPGFLSNRTLFLTTAEGEIYRSTNSGAAWTTRPGPGRILSNLADVHFRAVRLSPTFQQDQTLFLPTYEGLWKSTDAAASWRYVDIVPTWIVRSMIVSPEYATDGTLFGASYGGSIVRTTDGAATWDTLATGLANAYPAATTISASYGLDPTVFVGNYWGPACSLDNGASWTYMSMGTGMYAHGLAMSPAYATDLTVAMAVDQTQTGYPETFMWNGQEISTNGVFISHNGGADWEPTQLNGPKIQAVTFSPQFPSDGTALASVRDEGGLFRSTDGGYLWEPINNFPADCCLSRMSFSPGFGVVDQTIFISRNSGISTARGLYRSDDGGLNWIHTAGSERYTLLDFVLSPDFPTDGVFYAATLERGVLISTDGGATLTQTGLDVALVISIAISPDFGSDGTVFAGTYLGTFKTTDRGVTWIQTTTRTRVEQDRPGVNHTAGWNRAMNPLASASTILETDTPGEQVEMSYVGSDVSLIGARGPDFGMIEIWLDGELRETVDMYSPTVAYQQVLIQTTGVPFGDHTMVVALTGAQNPSSSGFRAVVDAWDIWR